MIYECHFLQNAYLVLQNIDHVADHVDGVAVDHDRQSEVRQQK